MVTMIHSTSYTDLVALGAGGQQRLPDGLLRAVGHHNVAGPIAQPVVRLQLVADRLPQRRVARVGRVPCVALSAACTSVACDKTWLRGLLSGSRTAAIFSIDAGAVPGFLTDTRPAERLARSRAGNTADYSLT